MLACGLVLACSDSKDAPSATETPVATGTASAETPAPGATATPAGTTPGPTKTPSPPPNARLFPDSLRQQVQPLLDSAVKFWGEPPKHDVAMYLIGRKDAIEDFRSSYDDEDRRNMAIQQDVYRLLSLIPPTTDIETAFLNLLGAGVLGYYNPDTKSFYLLDDIGGTDSTLSRVTIVHEFTHALQDQYYDLNAIGDRLRHQWDASTAFTDTIEGNAVQSEVAYMGSNLRRASCFTIPPVNDRSGLPYVLDRELNSWYDDGICFLQVVTPKLPRGHLSVFDNLPTTTEQILHPEKYLAGEKAAPVQLDSIDAALGEGWKQTERNTLGEFTLQNVLVLGLKDDRPRAQRGADGWGGDAWALYANADARLIEVSTVWDSATEAQEFFTTLASSLRNRGSVQPTSEAGFNASLEGKTWRAGLRDNTVRFVVSTDAGAVGRAAGALALP